MNVEVIQSAIPLLLSLVMVSLLVHGAGLVFRQIKARKDPAYRKISAILIAVGVEMVAAVVLQVIMVLTVPSPIKDIIFG